MKYLITGCAGFIGYHVTKFLLKKNVNVIGIDSLNNYYDPKLKKDRLKDILKDKKKFKFYKTDLCNINSLKKIFKKHKFDYIIHLAAQAGVRYSIENPYSYIDNNIQATTNILELCKKRIPKKILFASSSSVYGLQKNKSFKEDQRIATPVSFYAASKISMEAIAHSYSHLYNIPVKLLRFFTVYGPWGRPDMAYFDFTKKIIENKKINVFNNGNHYRDFTYITDIVNFIEAIVEKKENKKFEILNLGSNNPQKLKLFIELIEKKLKIKASKNYIGKQSGDMHGTHANMEKSIKNYSLKYKVDLKKGINNFIDWYIDYNKSKKY